MTEGAPIAIPGHWETKKKKKKKIQIKILQPPPDDPSIQKKQIFSH